jgi:formylglycine-generating enzyme required for sulfatase activity
MIAPLLLMAAIVGLATCASPQPVAEGPAAAETSEPPELAPFTELISGTTVTFEMLPIPAGTVTIAPGADGEAEPQEVEVGPFWMAETETTWDLYDIFMYELDNPDREPSPTADAVSRPSRPYIPPDRGFGHAGYPAISMTRMGAEEFCRWLSAKTGRRYRLPTEPEWIHAAGPAGSTWFFGDDVAQLDEVAWHARNSRDSTHPVGEKAPNPHGLRDVYGNAGEWIAAATGDASGGGRRSILGGSFLDEPADCATRSRHEQDRSWNSTDPQIPKSPWWLSDGSFVGFRVVCEVGEESRE